MNVYRVYCIFLKPSQILYLFRVCPTKLALSYFKTVLSNTFNNTSQCVTGTMNVYRAQHSCMHEPSQVLGLHKVILKSAGRGWSARYKPPQVLDLNKVILKSAGRGWSARYSGDVDHNYLFIQNLYSEWRCYHCTEGWAQTSWHSCFHWQHSLIASMSKSLFWVR